MNKFLAIVCSAALLYQCAATKTTSSPQITVDEITRIERTLSADNMLGRPSFGPANEAAANFIANEFKAAGIEPFGNNEYMQEFTLYEQRVKSLHATVGNTTPGESELVLRTGEENIVLESVNSSTHTVVRVGAGEDITAGLRKARSLKGAVLILVDTSHSGIFRQMRANSTPTDRTGNTRVYLLTNETNAAAYSVKIGVEQAPIKLRNVVGILRGKSKPNEYVLFSAHYDHLGIGKPNAQGDSIYNGANDDAAGTTAVIALSKYFKQLGNNERSIVFAAFTAEEMGGIGSQYFSRQLKPDDVVAMFNIEMIGTESKWGKNSAYITGYEKSSLGQMMQKNLAGTGFTFHPDPYPDQQLFYRSDNATLAALGVPAHTISTAKMDQEPHYHKASDEIGTLNMSNMAEIIRAIALSSRSLVEGRETPSRVAPLN